MKQDRRPLVRVANQILNRPVAITERWAAIILSALRSDLNVDLITTTEGMTINGWGMDALAAEGRAEADTRRQRRVQVARRAGARDVRPAEETSWRPYDIIDGVAVIEVSGTLTKNWGVDSYSGFTGYDGIKAKLIGAMDDDDVESILLDCDSPGGAVAGCFDLTDLIFACNQANGGKLIAAIANEQACSAAYSIMSAADPGWRFVPRTGEVGSIGVLMLHTDEQGAMAQRGIKVTIFRAGKWKAEGNSYEDMAEETVARIQQTLDEMRELFVGTVARNLAAGGRDVEALRNSLRETEALTYIGSHAREAGLVEAVASEDQVWARLMERRGRA